MKRTLIALAIAASVAVPVAAQAAPKVYGKLNLSVQNVDADSNAAVADSFWEVRSNASRFGVKGEDELTATLSAVYQIEWEVAGSSSGTVGAGGVGSANDSSLDLASRNRFVGIKSNDLGTIKLGRIDTYLKQAEGKVDLFNDLTGDFEAVLGAQGGPARANNVIDYSSPTIADLVTINVQLIQNEYAADGTPAAPAPALAGSQYGHGLADSISSSVVFSKDAFWAALAYNKDVTTNFSSNYDGVVLGANSSGVAADAIRLAATYNISSIGLTLGGLYQTAKSDVGATAAVPGWEVSQDGFVVSAALKFAEAWAAKLQYGQSTTDQKTTAAASVATDRTTASLGLDYNFTSKTRAFGFYTLNSVEKPGLVAATATVAATDTQDIKAFGIGLEHNF